MIIQKSKIINVNIDLTNKCQLSCPLCYRNTNLNKEVENTQLEYTDFVKILDDFIGIKSVVLAGNSEPTLYKDFFKLIDYLKFRNIKLTISTNAEMNDDSFWSKLKSKLNNQDKIVITFCGLDQEVHSKYRVGSYFDIVLRNAIELKDLCVVKFLRFSYNSHISDQQIYQFFNENGIKNVFIQNCDVNNDRNLNDLSFSINEKINENIKQFENTIKSKETFNIQCQSLLNKSIYIDFKGNIYPCLAYKNFSKLKFEDNDKLIYTDILKNTEKFCYICDKDMDDIYDFYKTENMLT